jgi:small GTP-binding protein
METKRDMVAIVGRPNVGKSTLFNRLIGQRRAIVGDEPGITRDRIYGDVEWAGTKFSLVDTGGIVPDDDAVIPANIFRQAGMAIEEARVLVWVVDARKGIRLMRRVWRVRVGSFIGLGLKRCIRCRRSRELGLEIYLMGWRSF